MRWLLSITFLIALTALASSDKPGRGLSKVGLTVKEHRPSFLFTEKLRQVLIDRKAAKFNLGQSKEGRMIDAYFFPGSSDKNALVMGGVHGSELSSIEVVKTLIKQLAGDSIYYNVIVIPSLFPDNAEVARKIAREIGSAKNIGRYSFPGAADPNRQMPTPGKAVEEEIPIDHAGREVEQENVLLLQLIQEFKPQRIASVHAIRSTEHAGFFADPRTDEQGIALGYETDSSLAVAMADYVYRLGGYVPGNKLSKLPTALYYKDPAPAAKGKHQKRNFTGSSSTGHKGQGISLGTWGTTAVKDSANPSNNRDAIRIITIEFPGSKRPEDHTTDKQRKYYNRQVSLFASSIRTIFLQRYYTEEKTSIAL